MTFVENPICYAYEKNTIYLYNLSGDPNVCEFEEQLFSNLPKSKFVVHYKKFSQDDKSASEKLYMIPLPQIGLLSDFLNDKSNNFFEILKQSKNFKDYVRKWIYQLVNSFYDIHVTKNYYHGYISRSCIFIDAKLNLQIGALGYCGDSIKKDIYYCDEDRKNKLKGAPDNFVDRFILEKNEENAIDNFRKYDVFALGNLIKEILNLSELKGHDEFDRINNEIIKLCLEPSSTRPNIETIKANLDQIYTLDNIDTIDIDDILQGKQLSELIDRKELIRYSIPELIAKKFEEEEENKLQTLMKCLHADDITFGLQDKYRFSVSYDAGNNTFITKPILLEKEGQNQIEQKLKNNEFCDSFFHNLYFCSLKKLLEIYKPSFTEIHYWMIYFANHIQALHSGDFLAKYLPLDSEELIKSPDAHLPLNFSSETVFVSFFNYENHKKFESIKSPLQFQLNVFPFDTKETKLSTIYKSNNSKNRFDNKRDIYSFGVLLLEILYKAIFDKSCFDANDDESSIKKKMEDVKNNLGEEQSFYKIILDNCINGEFENMCQIQIYLYLEGRDPKSSDNIAYKFDDFPSDNLNNYVNKHITMNKERFINIFKCISECDNDNIQKLFRETLNDLNQHFFKEDFTLIQMLNYLNFKDFMNAEDNKKE